MSAVLCVEQGGAETPRYFLDALKTDTGQVEAPFRCFNIVVKLEASRPLSFEIYRPPRLPVNACNHEILPLWHLGLRFEQPCWCI